MIAQLDKIYLKIAWRRVYSRLVSYLFYEGRPLTTKGRWINFFVFLNFQIFSRIPAPRKVVKPIFILGVGRSGSTILGKILSVHSQVGFLNEPKAFWYFLNPQDDIIGSYNKKEDGRYPFSKKDTNSALVKKAHNIYGWYLFFSGNRRIVDKYPEHIFRIDYLKVIFHDAKFILLVRNGRDNTHSISKWSEIHQSVKSEEDDWWGKNNIKWKHLIQQVATKNEYKKLQSELILMDDQKFRGAFEWLLSMNRVLELKTDKDTFLIRYEDLINETENYLSKLINFCDLIDDKKVALYSKQILYKSNYEHENLSLPLFQKDFDIMLNLLKY
jgi:hypothetical protein